MSDRFWMELDRLVGLVKGAPGYFFTLLEWALLLSVVSYAAIETDSPTLKAVSVVGGFLLSSWVVNHALAFTTRVLTAYKFGRRPMAYSWVISISALGLAFCIGWALFGVVQQVVNDLAPQPVKEQMELRRVKPGDITTADGVP